MRNEKYFSIISQIFNDTALRDDVNQQSVCKFFHIHHNEIYSVHDTLCEISILEAMQTKLHKLYKKTTSHQFSALCDPLTRRWL